jgi:hypothetical protein
MKMSAPSSCQADLPMSLPEVSPVKTSALRELRLALTAPGAVCGPSSAELLATFDPATQSWRMFQTCLVALANSQAGGLDVFSETWPRSGLMRNGIAYRLPPLVPLTCATEFGLLPTPEASNTKAVAMRSGGRPPRNFLLPTPKAREPGWSVETHYAKDGSAPRIGERVFDKNGVHRTWGLLQAVKMWPTPIARDSRTIKGGARMKNSTGSEPLITQVAEAEGTTSGALNPTWVEWLMGFPLGWTDLGPSETLLSRKSPNSSAARSSKPKVSK